MTEGLDIWIELWQVYHFHCWWGDLLLTPDMIGWCNGGWLV